MNQMRNETKNISKMEINDQFVLKDLYFFSFEYLSLLIKAKVFLSNYSIHRSITQLLKYLIAAALRGPITCIEWFFAKIWIHYNVT